MSPELWKEIEAVFEAVCDVPAAAREAFLDARCAGESDLRGEVEKLLGHAELAGDFMESPVWTDSFVDSSVKQVISGSLNSTNEAKDDFTGLVVGPYRLVDEIGRGGMGTVYRGERIDGEFTQEVAVKLLRRGLDSDFIVKRFRHERQILASFEHPFIARLLDGGTTLDGVPYFVMEYIRGGVTVFEWCDNRRLDIRARLKLFLKICSALEYAHERMIVHRDIKPSNILINRSGAPKLLDFGIAKILDPELIHESFHPTASVVRMMTPDYASPEQVRGLEITPASDIYSLGVLLYELLTGHRPYFHNERGLRDLTEIICEVEPEPPSKSIMDAQTLLRRYRSNLEAAEVRGAELTELSDGLRSLDRIVLRALAKDPADRFMNLSALADEISNYLAGQSQTDTADNFKGRSDAKVRSVAILPFRTISFTNDQDTGEQFLGVGLADSLISRLGRINRFLVVPTGSIISFNSGSSDPITAGRRLNVDYIVDGSIKIAGERLRLGVQLLDVKENAAVWATSIDERVGDFFGLEQMLSDQLIGALIPRISSGELATYSRRGTESPEAFEHYIRGRYHFSLMTEEHLARSFLLFHRAMAADPNYAHAYCGLANYYNWLGVIGVLPPTECFRPAIEAATRAAELDPELSEAHASLGFSLHVGIYDWKNADAHFRKAIQLNPNNANAYLWYSTFLYMSGRFDLGFEYANRAVSLDPLTPYAHYNLATGLYYARRFSEAEQQHRKVVEEFPSYGLGHYGLSKVHRYLGNTRLAIDENARAMELLEGGTMVQIAAAECLAADGQKEAALERVAELDKLSATRFVSPYQKAMVYSFLGQFDRVIDLLEQSLEDGEAWLCCAPVEARFEPVFGDDRFQAVLRAANHPMRRRASHFPSDSEPTRVFSDRTTILIENEID